MRRLHAERLGVVRPFKMTSPDIHRWTCALLFLSPSAFSAMLAGCDRSTMKAAKPKVLVLYADDWRHDTLGAAGNPIVRTPILDRLGADGFCFTNARVTTSICGVSRASLFTGQCHGLDDVLT